MRSLRRGVLYALCAPWDAIILALSMLLLVGGCRLHRQHLGVLWLDVREGSPLHRHWHYSTTFGHTVLLQPHLRDTLVEQHELVHVRQFEGAVCALWLAVACGAALTLWAPHELALLTVSVLGPWWSYAGASLAAFLRAERPYLDNHFERHARAETDRWPGPP